MTDFSFVSIFADSKSRKNAASILVITSLLFGSYLFGTAFFANDFKILHNSEMDVKNSDNCMNRCRPPGSEVLPEDILAKTSDLRMRPLWGSFDDDDIHSNPTVSLLAIAAGIKQKHLVDKIITKFLENEFVIMVFHYDGVVDQWADFKWTDRVIHISAMNQTKWWFAKRFLHPDIVATYDYIFLWDEDLDIDHFDPVRYVSIIKEEGLDISQPALDPGKSEVHHQITARRKNSKVHRNVLKLRGNGRCYDNSTGPPCLGWVEMMAPVFSKASWRCAWYLIQNDLIHGWGIDYQLGYCAQGDRKQKVGVVDAEYIVHLGVPSLGGSNHASNITIDQVNTKSITDTDDLVKPSNNSNVHAGNGRLEVRKQSYLEMRIFRRRWDEAVKNDKCWVDQYANTTKKCLPGSC
ncbi:uncharacterized protein [Rutidosis leptorrhynchoides]|uniref:uncharacterized protein isoform X2 n=1 Tax=Rutidosis leptorrhynchoides TaxID=125765 RepID=UPI003A99A91D